MKGKTINSILGLTLDGHRLEGALLKRARNGFRVQATTSSELSFNPLADDPLLAGREIKDKLAAGNLTERHCTVGVPLDWALTNLVKLPDLPEEHVDGFIRLQAEKSFPFGLDDLSLAVSRFTGEGDEKFALLTAVPRKHLDLLEKTLDSAGLKPLSFSLGLVALRETQGTGTGPAMLLFINPDTVSVLVTAEGGVVSLRSLTDAYGGDDPVRRLNGQALGRELRITLGQIPPGIRQRLKKIHVLGSPGLATTLAGEITARATALGLQVETVPSFQPNGNPVQLPFSGSVPPALALAARYLDRPAQTLEYLPPKVSQWARLATHLASRKAGILGGIGAFVAVVTIAALVWQTNKLSRLDSEWKTMAPKVKELDTLQSKIRKFRGWYDESQPNLRILKVLSEAFPENDSITAKSLEIRDRDKVTISGTARDNAAVLAVTEKLQKTPQVAGLKVDSMRGKTPLQFTFHFRWVEGGVQ